MSIGYGVLRVLLLLLRRLSVELLDEFLRGADCSFCVAMSYKNPFDFTSQNGLGLIPSA